MNTKPGYKTAAVLKAGIKVSPIAIGRPGTVAKFFKIAVTKTGKNGKEITVRGKDETYPESDTKEQIGVYTKIAEIIEFYYQKITTKP